ncbi:MAG TPA: tRNA (adenosine(37)-N6)-dimethylallyltransferase MiaA [Cyclobacteriaceae bacterium]|nr:tRNA (adenosine(37)-N6)-dimethylallyltransferase MiaA [Cyclobacteriaceae bacterium]
MQPNRKHLIVIVGPTAVGKTGIAIMLAREFHTEIISADSRQIYREMNIGTARPSPDELALVPHHFIGSQSISSAYNAAQYGEEALAKIEQLFTLHDQLILCGGSGLYVKAICDGFDDIPDVSAEIRKGLNEQYEKNGLIWLQEKMKELDPKHFVQIDQQNPQRLIRALEVILGTGASISTFQNKSTATRPFNIIKIGLSMDREKLYNRINARMDRMIERGLFEEARQLYPFKNYNALRTVGYQEIFDYFDGRYDRDEAVRLLKQNSRRYAKRQLTWFQKDKSIKWFDVNEVDGLIPWIKDQINY